MSIMTTEQYDNCKRLRALDTVICTLRACADRVSAIDALAQKNASLHYRTRSVMMPWQVRTHLSPEVAEEPVDSPLGVRL